MRGKKGAGPRAENNNNYKASLNAIIINRMLMRRQQEKRARIIEGIKKYREEQASK